MDNYAMSAYAEIGRSSLDEGAWAECLLSAISGHSDHSAAGARRPEHSQARMIWGSAGR